MYADVDWSAWADLPDRLATEDLIAEVAGLNWNGLQMSGTRLPVGHEAAVWNLIDAHFSAIADGPPVFPEEVRGPLFSEGMVSRITVNRYERDPRARDRCIAKHGVDCSVCGFNFEARYGDVGKGYIHVHHLREVSSLGADYQIDAVEDLRPLCPNCHAMAHRRRPAYDISELKAMLT